MNSSTYFLFLGIIFIIIAIISWPIYGQFRRVFIFLFMLDIIIFMISYLLEYENSECHGKKFDIPYTQLLI